tara:strand:+ start:43 stop:480 length:438 start_codon:yes stop_codon:yes gene_type:complete
MDYEITEVNTSNLKITYADGSVGIVPIEKDLAKEVILSRIAQYAPKTAYSSASDVPFTAGEKRKTTTDVTVLDESSRTWTYAQARYRHYPTRGDQLDALYWDRKGDSSHLTKIDEAIADTKAKWPKTLPEMTDAEYKAKVNELYG